MSTSIIFPSHNIHHRHRCDPFRSLAIPSIPPSHHQPINHQPTPSIGFGYVSRTIKWIRNLSTAATRSSDTPQPTGCAVNRQWRCQTGAKQRATRTVDRFVQQSCAAHQSAGSDRVLGHWQRTGGNERAWTQRWNTVGQRSTKATVSVSCG